MILGRKYSKKGKIHYEIWFCTCKGSQQQKHSGKFFEKSYKMTLSLLLIQNCQLLTDTTNDNQLKSRLRPSKDDVFSFLLGPCLSSFGVYNSVVLLRLSLFQAKIYIYRQTSKARGKWWQNRYILQTNKRTCAIHFSRQRSQRYDSGRCISQSNTLLCLTRSHEYYFFFVYVVAGKLCFCFYFSFCRRPIKEKHHENHNNSHLSYELYNLRCLVSFLDNYPELCTRPMNLTYVNEFLTGKWFFLVNS